MSRLAVALVAWLAWMPAGWADSSRDFDGSDDACETDTSVTTPTTMTMAAWINADTTGEGGFGRIAVFDNAGTGAAPTTGLSVDATSGGACTAPQVRVAFRADWSTSDGTWATACGANGLQTDAWFHITATYDGNVSTNDPVFYVNGTNVAVSLDTNGSGSFVTSSNEVILGNVDDGTRTWDGQLSHVQIYNRVLSNAEIQNLVYTPSAIPDGLIRWWPIWGSDSPEIDLSSTDENCTLAGTTASASGPPVMIGASQ